MSFAIDIGAGYRNPGYNRHSSAVEYLGVCQLTAGNEYGAARQDTGAGRPAAGKNIYPGSIADCGAAQHPAGRNINSPTPEHGRPGCYAAGRDMKKSAANRCHVCAARHAHTVVCVDCGVARRAAGKDMKISGKRGAADADERSGIRLAEQSHQPGNRGEICFASGIDGKGDPAVNLGVFPSVAGLDSRPEFIKIDIVVCAHVRQPFRKRSAVHCAGRAA